jgi:electron transport complex protein RnfB
MVKDNNEIYRKLRQEINKMPIAFPETNSGVEIRLLKYLFTPEEAEIAVHLNIVPEDLKRIHNRLEKKGITISIDDLEKTLDNMVIKGAILGGRIFESLKGDKKHYSLNQLAIGMFESQADRLTPEYARDFFSYFDDQFYKDFYGTKTAQMRTVPISVSLKPQLHVEPYNNIRDYIKNLDDDIVVMNCVCRQARDARGHPCTHSDIRETCFSFGDVARFFLGKGTGRAITSQEALQILDKAEEAGFVLQPENNRKPLFMCCCCRDCCHVLRGFKLHARPADLFHTNYFSKVDPVKCNG